MKTIQVFLASSSELSGDREFLERMLGRKSDDWEKGRGIKLNLFIWEIADDSVSVGGKQEDYNPHARKSDEFLLLCWRKAGMYTEIEYDTAFKQLQKNSTRRFNKKKKPLIRTYFKEINPGDVAHDSLGKFKDKLKADKHFETNYTNRDDLWNKYSAQLESSYPIESAKSSVWIGVIGLTLMICLGIFYSVEVTGKKYDQAGQLNLWLLLAIFGASVGAFFWGIMDAYGKSRKSYFRWENALAITAGIVTIILGVFYIVPSVSVYHVTGQVTDTNHRFLQNVEINVEGTEMLAFSDSKGYYEFTFDKGSRDSLFTLVTSHKNYQDYSQSVILDSPEIHQDIQLLPVQP